MVLDGVPKDLARRLQHPLGDLARAAIFDCLYHLHDLVRCDLRNGARTEHGEHVSRQAPFLRIRRAVQSGRLSSVPARAPPRY